MREYHKITTVFDRDPENKFKTLIDGQFSKPEFEYLANNEWDFTEKVDGTNIRIIWDGEDRKSTRLNSSHQIISYAVFCLKKKTELQSPDYLVCRLLLEKKKKNKKIKKKKKNTFS